MHSAIARILLKVGVGLAIIGIIAIASLGYIYWHIKPSLPNSSFLNNYQAPELSRVYDRHFNLIQEFTPVHRINLKIENIPEKIIAAFLVAEDKNFFYHPGIDPIRITRALFQNLSKQQNLIGASTITQQVAKNFLIGNEKSILTSVRD